MLSIEQMPPNQNFPCAVQPAFFPPQSPQHYTYTNPTAIKTVRVQHFSPQPSALHSWRSFSSQRHHPSPTKRASPANHSPVTVAPQQPACFDYFPYICFANTVPSRTKPRYFHSSTSIHYESKTDTPCIGSVAAADSTRSRGAAHYPNKKMLHTMLPMHPQS